MDKNITVPESKKLSERIKFLEAKKDELLRDKKFADKINIIDIKKFFSSFDNVIAQGDYESQSNILKCYIHRILFNPEKEEITLEFFELPKSNVITRTFGGARDRALSIVVSH